jgi:hypothetical protein
MFCSFGSRWIAGKGKCAMNDKEPSEEEGDIGPEDETRTSQSLSKRRADHFAERLRYVYLFHLWAEPCRDGKKPLWRFSLEEVETGVRHGFGNWEALVDFLQQRMAAQ